MSARAGGQKRKGDGPRILPLVVSLLTLAPNGAVTSAAAQTFGAARVGPTPVVAVGAAGTSAAAIPTSPALLAPSALTLPLSASALTAPSATAPAPNAAPSAPASLPTLPAPAAAAVRAASAGPTAARTPSPWDYKKHPDLRAVVQPGTHVRQAPEDDSRELSEGTVKFDGAGTHGRVALEAGTVPSGQVPASRKGPALKPAASVQTASVKELKAVLGDGVSVGPWGLIRPFGFHTREGQVSARTAGLEGFLYRKLELEHRLGEDALLGQWDDFFSYLDTLLSAAPWAGSTRAQLAELRSAPGSSHDKNLALNSLLARTTRDWQERLSRADPSSWGRQSSTYMILARAYNRMKPGKNFFDSLDEEELARIKQETHTDVLWLLDVFEIGEAGRWGSSGGSPYALKGYRFKKELGGEEGARRFIARAKKMGFRVGFDEVPNHTAIDSDQVELHPQDFIHILPPRQPNPGEDMAAYKGTILAQVPHHLPGVYSPLYQLLKTTHYPGQEGRPFWILVHQPITDYGDAMWLDMLQRDYSRKSARDWEVGEMRRLFRDMGISFARRDMAYYVLNAGYYDRWLHLLGKEKDSAQGWAREALEGFIKGFKARWAERNGSEFFTEMTDGVRASNPDAVFFDEIYAHETELSRTGSSGFYNKNDHDAALGQIGLYDAVVEAALHGDPGRLRAALDNVSFRAWQRGGASAVNFSVTHDGGEGNAVDKFGKFFRAVVAMTMLVRPTLVYNGSELGVGQRRMLIGDLSKSQDLAKAIPFDVPAEIDWKSADPVLQSYLRRVFEAGERNRDLFEKGAMDVLDAAAATPIVAWAAGRTEPATGRQRALVVAANFSQQEAWANFKLGRPFLKDFGAFQPRADRDYVFRDLANLDENGLPRAYAHSGRFLIENGLPIGLTAAGVQIFEVEELDPATARAAAAPISKFMGSPSAPSRWDAWTLRLTKYSLVPYFFLQIPQIIKNFANIFDGDFQKLSVLPWIGYSTGLLASFMLLSYFSAMKEKPSTMVQVMGIGMNLVVLGQLAYVGFMPVAAFAVIAPLAVAGLALNYLNSKGKAHPTLWKLWERGTALMALVSIPPSIFGTFGTVLAWSPAVTSIGSWAVGAAAFAAGLALIILDKQGKLSGRVKNLWTTLNAWTASMLYTLNPLIGLSWIALHPADIPGISVLTNVLNMAGAMLLLPRGLYLRNPLWIFGNVWAIVVGSWVALLAMTLYGAWSAAAFWPLTAAVAGYLTFVLWRNAKNPVPARPSL